MKAEIFQPPATDAIDPADADPAETLEWRDAFEAAVRAGGAERGRYLLEQLEAQARDLGVRSRALPYSAYRNTIDLNHQPPYPGDLAMEERISAMIRWNAMAMVVRANHAYGELGGHIASFASAAEIFETGFNHFFQGPQAAPIWFTSSRIRRPASTRGPFLRGAWPSRIWPATGRKLAQRRWAPVG